MNSQKKTIKKEKKGIVQEIEIDKDISISIKDGYIQVKGPKGESQKKLNDKRIKFTISDSKLSISSKISNKKVKKMINTFKAHIHNLITGVKKPFIYKLKICSGHFPMKVNIEKNKLIIQNFLGENIPRTLEFGKEVSVKVDGTDITVEGLNKELTGQAAASIEQLTRRTGYDTRIFQDGCYIIDKAGKELK